MGSYKESGRRVSLSPARARQQFAVHALTQAQEYGGLTLLVDGLAGMGKTYLLNELVDVALSGGHWQVTFVRADEIEYGEPYSFIERLVANSQIAGWHFTPTAQTSPIPVARECIQRFVVDADTHRRIIVIDDAQWIDAESQRVLRYLIPRITRRQTLLAFGVRTPFEPGSFGEFLQELVTNSPLDIRYDLAPLGSQEISALVAEDLGVGISSQTAQHILNHTDGSYLRVDSLIKSFTREETAELHVSWAPFVKASTPGNDPILHQYQQLTPPAQATCEIICLAGHELSNEELAATAKILGEPVNTGEALTAGVLKKPEYGSIILPRHDLLAQAVNDKIEAGRSHAVRQALARVTTGYRSLRHTLLSADEWSEHLHHQVNAYVQTAAQTGKMGIAAEVLRAALDLADEPAARAELLESLALIHIRDKTGYAMLDLLDELTALPQSVLHDFLTIVISAHQVGHALPSESVQNLLATAPKTPDERSLIAFFAFMVVILTMRTANHNVVPQLIAHAKMLVSVAPHDPAELADKRLEWLVSQDEYILVLDCYLMVNGQFSADFELVQLSLPTLSQRVTILPNVPLKVDALVALAGAHLAVGNASEGRRLAQQSVDMLEVVGEPWASSTARLILGDCMVLEGDFDDAIELMELTEEVTYSSLDVETRSSWAALRGIIATITGGDNPRVYVEQARRQREIPWEGYSPDLTVIADCELARANGDNSAILQATSGSWVEGLSNTRHGFLTYRVHALIDTRQLDEAATLVDQLSLWRGTRWQEYWGTLDWLRARLAQAHSDVQSAKWHYEAAIEHRAFPLPLGLSLADYGEFLFELGNVQEGVALMYEAIDTLERIGAESYVVQIREALQTIPSANPGRGKAQLFNTLTDRERQIVEHLVKGRSNSQIAESLVVSVTTVRSHVSNVLRKLRLSSRAEVARHLRDTAALE